MILLLGGQGDSTLAVYNHLRKTFGDFPAIVEQAVSPKVMIRNRIKKLGYINVASQLLFITAVRPVLECHAKRRAEELRNQMDLSPIPSKSLHQVESVNSPETCRLLLEHRPKVVIVNGTRIISKKVLNSTNAVFINTHAGITPRYRGAHGGYWALFEREPEHCGVTVHLVDEGIDTGGVIAQARIIPTADDNFTTYPSLQLLAGLPLLQEAVQAALDGSLETREVPGPSKVYYHPGALQYLRGRLRGVR